MSGVNDTRVGMIRVALAILQPQALDIRDDSHRHAGHEGARDGRGHFTLEIVSAAFEGLGPVARHRMVYQAVGALMQTDVHALSIRARTPQEAGKP